MINKVMLVGTVKSEPAQRGTGTNFRMQTWKIIHDGRRFDTTHTIQGWGRTAELMSTMKEGELISVEGEIKHSSYEKDGRKVWFTQVTASSVSRCGEAEQPNQQQNNQAQPQSSPPAVRNQSGKAPAAYPPASSNKDGASATPGNAGYDEKYGF